jgi:hypothetical protein
MGRNWHRSDLLGLTSLNEGSQCVDLGQRPQWTQLALPGESMNPVRPQPAGILQRLTTGIGKLRCDQIEKSFKQVRVISYAA